MKLRWPHPFGQFGGPTKLIPDHDHAASGMDDTVSGVWAKAASCS